jgi:predicted DsbA family dithiol-disulfide isomerase
MVDHLKQTADDLGLPFGERTMTYNSRLAQELGLWAESEGRGKPFHMAAFRAYFADGVNLARTPILLKLAEEAGLSREKAEKVLTSRSFQKAVDRDWTESQFKAITAVPTFTINNHRLVGAQSYESLARLVTENDIESKELP